MLPTLPDLERRRERMNLDRIHEMSRGLSPFAREIKAHIQHEGVVKAMWIGVSDANLSPLGLISEAEREGGPASSQTSSQH